MRYLILQLLTVCAPLWLFAQSVPADGQPHSYTPFNRIEATHHYRLIIVQDTEHSISIEAADALLPFVQAKVHNGKLTLTMDPRINHSRGLDYDQSEELTVRVTMRDLDAIELSGVAIATAEGFEGLEGLRVDLSGVSRFDIEGSVKSLQLSMTGVAEFDGQELVAENCRFELQGVSRAEVFVTKKLAGEVAGVSTLRYYGNPTERDLKVCATASAVMK